MQQEAEPIKSSKSGMTLKPSIIRDVKADALSMQKAIGPKLAERFSANPKVAEYALVLKFPDGVVTGRAVSHALVKIPSPRGSTLLAGTDFTVEATKIAAAEGCDMVSVREFGWTDATYAESRAR